jgi:hypothetical protein
MRRAGTIADVVWNGLADSLNGTLLTDADGSEITHTTWFSNSNTHSQPLCIDFVWSLRPQNADLSLNVDKALAMKQVWARRHSDSGKAQNAMPTGNVILPIPTSTVQ